MLKIAAASGSKAMINCLGLSIDPTPAYNHEATNYISFNLAGDIPNVASFIFVFVFVCFFGRGSYTDIVKMALVVLRCLDNHDNSYQSKL